MQVVAKAILDANLDRYQLFFDVESGKAIPSTWKLVKTKGQMSAYVQRQRKHGAFPFQVNPTNENCALQSLLLTGSIPGTLDDVMRGISNSQAEDDLSRAAVILTIRSPTASDPFKSVVVKWMELDVRFKSMGFVKNHDYVYVETIGTLQLPNGTRIGYHLLHSVDLPEAHNLPGRIRGKLSVCSFFRQVNENAVSVYTLGTMDSMSDKARRVIIPRFIKALLISLKNCGQTKKKPAQISGKRLADVIKLGSQGVDHSCVICSKRVLRLGKLLNYRNTYSVCSSCVCSSCKIEKKMKLVTSDLKVIQRKVVFCSPSPCLNNALATSVPDFSSVEKSNSVAGFYTSDYRSIWESRSRISTSGNVSAAW